MLTEIRRKAHNTANKKWRLKNPYYMRIWQLVHPEYVNYLKSLPEYQSWCHMKSRCYNPKTRQYRWYGAKGIKVLYKSFEEFLGDVGKRPKGKSIDRINNNGNYELGNCKWSTQKEQCSNRGGMFA